MAAPLETDVPAAGPDPEPATEPATEPTTPVKRHRVAVLVQHGVIPFELGIPHRIFGGARTPDGTDLYEVRTCTPGGPGLVRAEADFEIAVPHGPEILEEADTVIVPAAHEHDSAHSDGRLSPGLAAAFARIRPGARLVSICTGSYFLAAAGYLDGLRATTHWSSTEHFQRLYPRVRVEPDVLYVDNGHILTSAGVASGIDLCLYLLRRDHGSAVANASARRTVVPPHREGGQAQYVQRPVPEPQLATTATARAWALSRLDRPLTLRELAGKESMSVRTFTRRFREEVGISPGQWLVQQRVERARHLLESSDLSVDQVARDAGFGTAASMRQHLQAALGVSPTAYRRTFRDTAAG
ncbi:GlxA family transcriptional regulator [Streptomyces sp. NPDC088354]|uniref:GlxA family transcriptional regulator n=1 Tax=unclassified Streptomyces TaxID=2593676 RepID=UPI0029A59752|nr:helix-turn-helix domain-containing protein [Streptomyces sp. MI02-7b]MDX3076060.1 helix-turn-helix domain-containing protein [Streptomyces sp. MI02-7b]